MKFKTSLPSAFVAGIAALALLSSASTARANVYATDIKVNGGFSGFTGTNGAPVTISYRLNQTADLGVTINFLSGGSAAATIPGGTNMGLNTVSWTPTFSGTFSIGITAAASGFPFWTQISVDTNAGMPAAYPAGIDVDKNTNSPYYGRVVLSCGLNDTGVPAWVPAAAQKDGLYKMNADGSQADEGWFGYAGYTNDDIGDPQTAGQMPFSGGYNPLYIRIGDDDRIYWNDNSAIGAIIACDMQASTNNGYQVVIDEGTLTASYFGSPVHGTLRGPNNYSTCPEAGDLLSGGGDGVRQFDVTATTTAQAAIWLMDTEDSPNWGVWMFHLKNGASDPADTAGTQAVATGSQLAGTSSGLMVDSNLDIFISQNETVGSATNQRSFDFKNWNGGVLPPEAGGTSYAAGKAASWLVGSGSSSLLNIQDTVIDSRAHPKYVALPMLAPGGGIGVLNAADGSVAAVTNGVTVQTLTNLDFANQYTCAAWDNVGNLYGASVTTNIWRVWSPPGASTNSTVALALVVIPPPPVITGIAASPITPGNSVITISFTGPSNLPASAFLLIGSGTASGGFTNAGAALSGASGNYQAVVTNSATQFYMIEQPAP